jgi:molybdate transport system ATP-binding protein
VDQRGDHAQKDAALMLRLDHVRLPLAHFELAIDFESNAQATGIFGPSGAGKTTILELIAGIQRPAGGRIILDGLIVDDVAAKMHVPSRRRAVGYVPQGNALFPHMTVERNIRYGLILSREDGEGSPARLRRGSLAALGMTREPFVHRVIEVLEIAPLLPRGVRVLSGGEAKRVALARALVIHPKLLLLDEPLAGLDRPLHGRIIDFLVRVRDELHVPMLYVSHDPAELRRVVFDAIVIDRGELVAHGPAGEVLGR